MYLCIMNDTNYDLLLQLASLMLPSEMLLYFNIVRIEEDTTTVGKELIPTVHIYLDEADNREHMDGHNELRPNGYTEPTTIADFPLRKRKLLLHVRRRRWLDNDGCNYLIKVMDLIAPGTSLSPELASFLKGGARY